MPIRLKTLALGVGSFAQGILRPLRESGTKVQTYLTRSYGHAGPATEGPTFDSAQLPDLPQLLAAQQPDLIIPQSIDWSQKPWAPSVFRDKWPILCPTGDALLLERDRDFSRHLGSTRGIPFPESIVIPTRAEAEQWVKQANRGFVLKNPLCSPNSPLHTIVSRSAEETLAYENIARLQCAGTYYRTDVGCSLQPGLLSPIHPGKIAKSVGETIDVA